jgi:WD40 repeat protein
MTVSLLLADPHGDPSEARVVALGIQLLQTPAGGEDITVSFQPNRSDDLHASGKAGAQLAYRILFREGIVRSQLVVRCRVPGAPDNVVGRSADLAFAVAIVVQAYRNRGNLDTSASPRPRIAATGRLDPDGSVRAVNHLPAKLRAAVQEFGAEAGVVFFPASSAGDIDVATLLASRGRVELVPVGHVEEILERLGIALERVCLRNPFRGLEYFDYEHRSIFFGRRVEIDAVLRQLFRRERAGFPGVSVEGPSGSGKSSFLRAGLLPALVDPRHQPGDVQAELRTRPVSPGIRNAIWRPGLVTAGIDESGIVGSILDCWATLPDWPTDWNAEPALTLDHLITRYRSRWPSVTRFVWVVDQFEELFTLGLDDQVLNRFGQFLRDLQTGGAWTLASIREDAVPLLKRYESLRVVFGANEGGFYLPSVRGVALDEVIELPARAADLTFGRAPDGRGVDQLLREEAYREPDSLPLLQFTLNELYVQRVNRELTYDCYQRLGGLSGSIASTAERILVTATPGRPRSVRRLFRNLISVDDNGRATRRHARAADIANDAAQQSLVAQLIEARLCITNHRGSETTVAFAHDSLLSTLPAIARWLQEEGALLQTREVAQRDARLWAEHGESRSWLAESDRVLAFQALDDAEIPLAPETRRFIEHSRAQRRRNLRLKQAAVAIIGMLAVTASIGAWLATVKQREAAREAADARRAELQLLTEAAAERLQEGDLSFARGIILEVLRRELGSGAPDPAAVNVLEEIRATDPARVILAGHQGPLRRLTYSPDGSRIASSSLDGTARIWDARTGAQLLVLPVNLPQPNTPGFGFIIKTATFSPDGADLLTATGEGTIQVWNATSGGLLRTLAHGLDDLQAAAYSPDGRYVAAATGRAIGIFDARTGKRARDLSGPGSHFTSVEYSRDGALIVAASTDDVARIWDVSSGKQLLVLKGHDGEVQNATFSADGARILTASSDATARLWDSRTGATLHVLRGHRGMVYYAAFSPDGRIVATTGLDKTVRIWDALSGQQQRILSGHVDGVNGVAFSPDNRHLVSGGWDETGRTWDLREDAGAIAVVHEAGVWSVAFSSDGTRLLSSSGDGTAIISKTSDGTRIASIADQEAGGRASYSPDGRRLMTVGNNRVRIRDVESGNVLVTIGPPDADEYRRSAVMSPDGRYVLASTDNFDVAIHDAASGASLRSSERIHADFISSVSFSPDGRQILTSSVDKTARISDASSFAPVAVLPHKDSVNQASYSPDGTRIVTATNDGLAHIWDARTAAEIRVLSGHREYVSAATFSPDGARVATGSVDGTARVWDTATGVELGVLAGHHGKVVAVSFSPDGRLIATASTDHLARIWAASPPANLREQVLWEQAVEPDPLSEVQRTVLGLPSSMTALTNDVLQAGGRRTGDFNDRHRGRNPCGDAAASYYDPDRSAWGLDQSMINARVAILACSPAVADANASGQSHYQAGRALLASADFAGARQQFEKAIAKGYRAANVDFGLLLLAPAAHMIDGPRAASAFRKAWDSGAAIGGFELAVLYEHGLSAGDGSGGNLPADASKAWALYEAAAQIGEPHAIARLAERADHEALERSDTANAHSLEAFTLYARAAERARQQDWPDVVWRAWRYRRASLARLLADANLMPEVARRYADEAGSQAP